MRDWAEELGWIALASSSGALIGALFDAAWAGAFFALLTSTLWRARNTRRFTRWHQRSGTRPTRLRGRLRDVADRIWNQRQGNRRRTRALIGALRQLQTATDALPDAALILDGADTITWCNGAGARMLKLDKRAIGRPLTTLLRSPEIAQLLDSEGETTSREVPSPLDDRNMLEVRLISIAADRRLLLVRDITQVVRLRQMRQDFIANVSHELRTPLTVIIGYLEALEDEADPQLMHHTLARLHRPAARMKLLVEDLLLLSRLDTSPPPEADALREVAVAGMIRRICADAAEVSDADHHFVLDLDDDISLQGMDVELHSAFSNLILNAVRYSPDGGDIGVRWRAERDGARFEVTDAGIGIAREHLPRITERFYRIDVGRSRAVGGTGLGLAIVKHVLLRHDSELEIDSTLGEGSTFSCAFGPQRVLETQPNELVSAEPSDGRHDDVTRF